MDFRSYLFLLPLLWKLIGVWSIPLWNGLRDERHIRLEALIEPIPWKLYMLYTLYRSWTVCPREDEGTRELARCLWVFEYYGYNTEYYRMHRNKLLDIISQIYEILYVICGWLLNYGNLWSIALWNWISCNLHRNYFDSKIFPHSISAISYIKKSLVAYIVHTYATHTITIYFTIV